MKKNYMFQLQSYLWIMHKAGVIWKLRGEIKEFCILIFSCFALGSWYLVQNLHLTLVIFDSPTLAVVYTPTILSFIYF